MSPASAALSFRRIVDVPFETCVAALDSWQRTGHGGEPRSGAGQVPGPKQHDPESGTCQIQIRLARGPLRPPRRMRLDIDRWSASSTALELIPCGRVQPTAAYFRAGHLLLDLLTRSLPQHLPPADARDTMSRAHVPAGSGASLTTRAPATCPPQAGSPAGPRPPESARSDSPRSRSWFIYLPL